MVYKLSARFSEDEIYAVTSQLRRAASSVPANMAEGSGRKTTKDFLHFLDISLGSLKETEYFLLLAHDLKYINDENYIEIEDMKNQTLKCLVSYIKSINND